MPDGTAVAAVVRLSRVHATDAMELSLVVADAWQRRGIGRELVVSAITVARAEGASEIVARLSPENRPMRSLLVEAGFSFAGPRRIAHRDPADEPPRATPPSLAKRSTASAAMPA